MSKPRRSKLRREIEAVLKATGYPWSIENGGRHHRIILDGHLIGITSMGMNEINNADTKNVICKIRKYKR